MIVFSRQRGILGKNKNCLCVIATWRWSHCFWDFWFWPWTLLKLAIGYILFLLQQCDWLSAAMYARRVRDENREERNVPRTVELQTVLSKETPKATSTASPLLSSPRVKTIERNEYCEETKNKREERGRNRQRGHDRDCARAGGYPEMEYNQLGASLGGFEGWQLEASQRSRPYGYWVPRNHGYLPPGINVCSTFIPYSRAVTLSTQTSYRTIYLKLLLSLSL